METELILPIPTSYELQLSNKSKRALLVLHGFSDHGLAAQRRLLGSPIPDGFTVLAPNGIFPVPVKKADGYHRAYAWYFRDPDSGLELISPEFAASAILVLLNKLGIRSLDWTILGFSQGAFLAPYLVRAGLQTKNLFAVGAAYRPEAYEDLPALNLTALHGEKDDIVSFESAKSSFEQIKKMGYGKDFYALPDLAHSLNDEGRTLLWRLLQKSSEA